MKNIKRFMALYEIIREDNPYTYMEIACTKQTDYMAWICSRPREVDPDRKVIATGQADTADKACKQALKDYHSREKKG